MKSQRNTTGIPDILRAVTPIEAQTSDARARLARLGFLPQDAHDALLLLGHTQTRPAWREEVQRLTHGLEARVGLVSDRTDPIELLRPTSIDGDVAGGSKLALLALVGAADTVLAEYRRRGLRDEIGWRALSDLGRQVAICRRVHGIFGLHVPGWVAMGYTGGTLWIGRLQYTLEPCPWDPDRHVLGVHIPDDGPLTAEDVDASFDEALRQARAAYPEAKIIGFTCTSWLLDPGWRRSLPTSNLVRFANRFEAYGEPRDGRRDALYFVFDRETLSGAAIDTSDLPQRTSLQRAVLERLTTGDPLLTTSGRIRMDRGTATSHP